MPMEGRGIIHVCTASQNTWPTFSAWKLRRGGEHVKWFGVESRFCLLAVQPWASGFASLSLSMVSHLLKGLGDDNNTYSNA